MRPIQFLTPEQVAAIPEYQDDLQGLVKHCSWILAVDGLCIVCDRPTQINLNEKHQFQSEAAPALQYSYNYFWCTA